MTTIMSQFIVDIYHNNKLYTVQQVLDYIDKTIEKCPSDEKVRMIGEDTKAKIKRVMDSYGLSVHSILKKSDSPAGKMMSRIAYEHCNEVIKNRQC